jgi:hypothetical protein
MSEKASDQDKGFTIVDRRARFDEAENADNAPKKEKPGQEQEAQKPQSAKEPAADRSEKEPAPGQTPPGWNKASAKAEDGRAHGQPLPKVNFATFVISLSSSVLVYLGEIEDPESGAKLINLPVAKQTIDILGMLEEKSRGNLNQDEEHLLKNILYDLRLRFVKATSTS